MNNKIAIALSVAVFLSCEFAMSRAMKSFGIPTFIDEEYIDENGYLADGYSTDAAMYGVTASAMIAWRAYRWFSTGKLRGGFSRRQELTWNSWFLGFTAYFALSQLVWNMDISVDLQGTIIALLGLVIAFAVYQIHGRIAISLSQFDRADAAGSDEPGRSSQSKSE